MVTRPSHQADGLARRLEAAGARVIRLPVLAIVDLESNPKLDALINRLDEFALAIFVSANAVKGWVRLVLPRRTLPPQLRLVAVGAGTASALEQAGLPSPLRPGASFGSEYLLDMPELSGRAIAGLRILIVRGIGGRELLSETLKARGASVEYMEIYRRVMPPIGSEELLAHRCDVDVIMVTSVEALRNLFEIGGPKAKEWLCSTALIVVSERIARLAEAFGVQKPPIIADHASDEALLEALQRWHRGTPAGPWGNGRNHDGVGHRR